VAAAVAVARQHGGGDPTVATVGGKRITRSQLELMVQHFHEEADAEGRPFPTSGTGAYRRVERQSLAFLLDRAKLEAAAARAGVHVDDGEVERRLRAAAPGGEAGEAVQTKAAAAFARSTARTQLVTEKVFERVTAGVAVGPAAVRAYYRTHRTQYGSVPYRELAASLRRQVLSARKNAVMARWVARARTMPADIVARALAG
jgi:hypothetical protein